MKKYDVIVVGGGIIGSSVAYFLSKNKGFKGSVLVLEKDPDYFKSSTALSVGGFRQQFSTPENIEISKFGADFIKKVDHYLTIDGYNPDIFLRENGYMFLATSKGMPTLRENYYLQQKHGVEVKLLTPEQLSNRFPWLNTEDLAGGSIGHNNEGWIDPISLLKRFIGKAKSLGVTYIKDEVVGIDCISGTVREVRLKNGKNLSCGVLINAAGPKAAEITKMMNIPDFPVHSRKRQVFTFKCKEKIENCPMIIDPSGVYFRPEGEGFLCGVSPPKDQDPDCNDFKINNNFFEENIWPVLANRVKYFDQIKQEAAWAGHYAYNTLDQNVILGFHPEFQNFILANGFSGHGLQQAPGVGRAVSELIIYKEFKTLDLSRFGYERIKTQTAIKEKNVV